MPQKRQSEALKALPRYAWNLPFDLNFCFIWLVLKIYYYYYIIKLICPERIKKHIF